jgi:hypothetical protein
MTFISDDRITLISDENKNPIVYLDGRSIGQVDDITKPCDYCEAIEQHTGFAIVVPVEGGWMGFNTMTEYRTWEAQI